jgi:hypothetical protein
MKKDYWTKIGESFYVYNWSKKYNRFINTHAWDTKRDAELTIKQRKKK